MIALARNSIQKLMDKDTFACPFWQRVLIRTAQIFYATLRDLADGHLSLRAMSLVYTTLITLVPLLAISFSVLKGFGAHNQLEEFLPKILEGLGPEKAHEITERVIGFVDNIKVGVLGAVGLALLLYAVIALMQKIEEAFNYIWRVGQDRTFAQRFSNYLSVLLMGPVLIFLSAGITTTIRNQSLFQKAIELTGMAHGFSFVSIIIPWLVMAMGFTFFYVYMPNTKVRISSAFVGAMVAALLWKLMGYLFASFIASSANYVAIYAAFATLIIFMIWLYASWLVVLLGSNVAFYVQYPRYLAVSREPLILSPYTRVVIGLSILTYVARAYSKDEEAWSIDRLSKELNVPILAVQKVIEILEEGHLLTASGKKDPIVYLPAKSYSKTPLSEAISVLEKKGQSGWGSDDRVKIPGCARDIMKKLEASRNESLGNQSLMAALVPDD